MTYYWPFEGKVKLCFVLLKDDSKEAGNNTDDDEWGEKKEKVIFTRVNHVRKTFRRGSWYKRFLGTYIRTGASEEVGYKDAVRRPFKDAFRGYWFKIFDGTFISVFYGG